VRASDMSHRALWVVEPVHTVPIAQVAAKRQHENVARAGVNDRTLVFI